MKTTGKHGNTIPIKPAKLAPDRESTAKMFGALSRQAGLMVGGSGLLSHLIDNKLSVTAAAVLAVVAVALMVLGIWVERRRKERN